MRKNFELIQARLTALAAEDGVPEVQVIEDWEASLEELAECGFNVAELAFELAWFKNTRKK